MSDARILDRGYRPYDGPRLGVRGAVRSLIRHTVQRVLGLRQPARSKALPLLSAVIAYVPAIVFVGLAAFIPDDELRPDVLPSYGDYYGFVSAALVVFTALVAPEALCPDRRSGLLGLYLASPLDRASYLFAKATSVFGLLLIATLGPPLLMLIAFTLQGLGPDGPDDVLLLLVRVVVSGALVAAVYTAISLGAASLTDRRAVASAGILMTLMIVGIATGVLVEGMDAPRWVYAFDPIGGPFELVQRVYGELGEEPDIPVLALIGGWLGWTVLGAGTVWIRYQRLEVTR